MLRRKKVLIVDDSPLGARCLGLLVNSLGMHVQVATDGEQALQNTRCHDYSLVLMDLRLPGKDGFETARAIRKDGNHVPIIAISAYPVNSDWQRCTEAGIDDALCKGFQLEELARVIKLWANSDIVKPLFDERRMQKLMATAG